MAQRAGLRRLLLVVLLLLLTSAPAHARAGGGHGFSGGGSRSSGSHGGGFRSSGGGGSFRYSGGGGPYYRTGPRAGDETLFWFVVVLIIFLVIAVNAYRQYQEAVESGAIKSANSPETRHRDAEASLAMRRADPGFDKDAFLARVRLAFDKTQAAWSDHDLSSVRAFLSDGVHERFGLQFLEQDALGYRNHVEDVQILSCHLAQADAEGPFDTLSVRITARARDYDVSVATGQKVPGTDRDEPFAEIWSFLRRRGAQTDPTKPGLIEGHCPNCGAQLSMNRSANCEHCGSLLRSGQFDWVLAEITQESVWRNLRPSSMPGVDTVRRSDPGLTVQELEDFASVCFWRKVTADRARDPRALAKVSSPEFVEDYARRLMPRPTDDGSYGFIAQCAVGSVRTLGIIPDDERQLALLEVRWSGTRFAASPSKTFGKTGPDVLTRTLLVLARSAAATSNVDLALSSNHCPGCGAPLSLDTASTCESCGNVLNDPRNGWVLHTLHSLASPEATNLVNRLSLAHAVATMKRAGSAAPVDPSPAPADLLAWLVNLAMSDGVTTSPERAQLNALAGKHRIPQQHLTRLLNAAAHDQLHAPEPSSDDEARAWLTAMADLALCDGRVHPAELTLMRAASRRLNWSDYDLDLLLKRRRQDLYAVARSQSS